MSEIPKRVCVFGCDPLVTFSVPIHRFPHPEKRPDDFDCWMSVIGEKLKQTDRLKVYKSKRVCDHHFHPTQKISTNRLKLTAVPSENLHRVQQCNTTFVVVDHCYTHPKRESFQAVPLMDFTNLPGPSRPIVHQTEMHDVTVTDKKSDTGVRQLSSTFVHDHCYTKPQQDNLQSVRSEIYDRRVPLMDITNIPGPSRLVDQKEVPDKLQLSKSHMKFDAEKTVEFLQNKSSKDCTRKILQKQNEIRRLRKKVTSFKLRLRQMKQLLGKNNFEKLTENMSVAAKLFTRMQYKESKKKKKGHRFTLDEKVLSLSLYKKSPKAYTLMCKHFTLPSRKVLKALLAQVKLNPGINPIIFKELRATVSKMLPRDRLCTLIFDEMSISPQIFYNSHTDDLIGFENFGKEKTPYFANHALVFMVKGIKKNFKQPVAYYFTQRLSTPRLKEILKDVVSNVLATGLKIVATVCDQGSPNTSCMNSLISEAKSEYFKLGKTWQNDVIIIDNQEIIPLYDVPHLLKGLRNNLLNKELHYNNNNELKLIKWEYFQKIFLADKAHEELRLIPKLTREHVDPKKIKKMRVKLAAQVFSHSMAVGIDNLVARGNVPLEYMDIIPFVLMIDKLFDSLNSSSFSAPQGKKFRAAIRRNSPHHKLWQDALHMLKTIKFMVKRANGIKIAKNVPSVSNLIKTINGIKSLWQLLSKKYKLDAMFTRNLNQDPLENFFGSIRSLGARNVAPNCMGFEGAFKTLLLNNMSSDHSINSNCENDSNKCLQSISFFLKQNLKSDAPLPSQNIVIDEPLNVMEKIDYEGLNEEDSGADQRTYVCGWALTKCLKNVVKGCNLCKSKLLGDSTDDKYRFIRGKEYEKEKQWLCYPSDRLVACFKEIQKTTIAFLNNECHQKNIKERITVFIVLFTDFSFMDCPDHKEKLKECFLNTTINIIIYSWCRTVNKILEGKLIYEGEDSVKKAAQLYFNTHKAIKR